MIDARIFNELINRGIITHVGLNPNSFTSLEDLQKRGIITSTNAQNEYYDVINDLAEIREIRDKFIADVVKGGTVKLPIDILLDDYIEIRNNVTIDLNGHHIIHPISSSSKYKDVFEVLGTGHLTIIGTGKVIAEDGYSIYAAGDSIVEINGGEYISSVTCIDARKTLK